MGAFVAYLQQQMLTLKDESALEVMGKTVFHCLALFLAFLGKLYDDKVRRIATKLRTWRKLLPKKGELHVCSKILTIKLGQVFGLCIGNLCVWHSTLCLKLCRKRGRWLESFGKGCGGGKGEGLRCHGG